MVVDICKIFELNSHYWRLSWGKNLQKTKFKVILRKKLTELLLESHAVWREKTRRIMMMMIMMIIKTLAFMKMMLRFFFLPLYNNPFDFLEGFGARLIIKWLSSCIHILREKEKKKCLAFLLTLISLNPLNFMWRLFSIFEFLKFYYEVPISDSFRVSKERKENTPYLKVLISKIFFSTWTEVLKIFFFSRGFSFFSLSIMAQSKNFLFFHIFWCCLVVFPYFLSSKQKTKKPKLTEGGP